MWRVCSQQVTACLTLASVANPFPAICLFVRPNRCKSLDPYCQLELWLVSACWAGACEPPPFSTVNALLTVLWMPSLQYCECPPCSTVNALPIVLWTPSLQCCECRPWSTDLAPSDFQLCGHLQKYLVGKRYAAVTDLMSPSGYRHLAAFFLHQDTSLASMIGTMFKCQWSWC